MHFIEKYFFNSDEYMLNSLTEEILIWNLNRWSWGFFTSSSNKLNFWPSKFQKLMAILVCN